MYFGIARLQRNAGRRVPGVRPALVEIQTPSLGLSAEEVEELVTIPLEQALNGVPGLDVMRSKSVARFVGRQDDLQARNRSAAGPADWCSERMRQVQAIMPTWSAPPVMLPPLSATSRMHEDRHLVEEAFGHRPVDDRPTGRSASG